MLASLQPLVATARPNWVAGDSVCHTFPDFAPADLFPIRSPLVAADYIGSQVQGKAFCEIGTRNGDVMSCVSKFASSVTAIEMDPGYCAKLRSRGFGVACERVEDIPREDFPVAEAYYWWPSDAHGQNELWLRIVARALRAQGRRASVFVGFDTHWEPDMSNLPLLVRKYNGTVTRLFFDEGGAVHGPARGSPVYDKATHKLLASIEKPFFSRPGHWGIFHVARFDVGPSLWAIMRANPYSHPDYNKQSRRMRSTRKAGRLG